LEYGFPLPWKTLVFERGVCPPSYEIACFLGPALAVYNWSFFALDTAFYIALSYAFVVAGRRAIAKSVSWRTLHLPNWG